MWAEHAVRKLGVLNLGGQLWLRRRGFNVEAAVYRRNELVGRVIVLDAGRDEQFAFQRRRGRGSLGRLRQGLGKTGGGGRRRGGTSGGALCVQGVVGVHVEAQGAHALPIAPLALGQALDGARRHFQLGEVLLLGVNFGQFDVNVQPIWGAAQGFGQNFDGFIFFAIGQVHIGLGDGVHIAIGIQLAWRVRHGAGRGVAVGINLLAATAVKQRIRGRCHL